MEQALKAFLDGILDPEEFEIHYHIGGGLWGETEAHLRGTGAYRLSSTVTDGRQLRTYAGRVDTAEVRELTRVALRVRLWEAGHVADRRGRDNPDARIDVTAGAETYPVVLWVSETDEVPAFNEVQQRILDLVRRLSGGEVLEVGR